MLYRMRTNAIGLPARGCSEILKFTMILMICIASLNANDHRCTLWNLVIVSV
ncbi:hypothetical protein PBCV1_a348aR [Paramecium bursaria Chlorella virus 1]|uniref:Uncharacterized protein n=1 Tax=Paramecium bursaria Chlorella virus 1 TaxID=10506 RepID=F8TU23_PBCV1|nr:hypothetical protein PBCV1_a348aR [Paramecium bursaria Chlorella virus 1]AEI70084.1 hypothetical protein [Paramecium bursaria Chlorella virus 1]